MALKEEFEYIAFRCAYCYFLNPARKTRPQAPQIPEFGEKKTACLGSSTIASESDQYTPESSSDKSNGLKEEVELMEHQATESQTELEEQPVLESAAKTSEASDKSDNEQNVSAMEVE